MSLSISEVGGALAVVAGIVFYLYKLFTGSKKTTEKVAAAKQEYKDAVERIDKEKDNKSLRDELLGGGKGNEKK